MVWRKLQFECKARRILSVLTIFCTFSVATTFIPQSDKCPIRKWQYLFEWRQLRSNYSRDAENYHPNVRERTSHHQSWLIQHFCWLMPAATVKARGTEFITSLKKLSCCTKSAKYCRYAEHLPGLADGCGFSSNLDRNFTGSLLYH